jgi:hypothetical protein
MNKEGIEEHDGMIKEKQGGAASIEKEGAGRSRGGMIKEDQGGAGLK